MIMYLIEQQYDLSGAPTVLGPLERAYFLVTSLRISFVSDN
jgi:hypothetical protein